MKRILSLLLCMALLIPLASLGAEAKEEVEFYKVQINAGSGTCVEQAIFGDDELYIPASSFSRYTRFTFNPDTNTFLVAGQEEAKAFKKVVVDPVTKRLAVGTRLIELNNCYVVEGELYLPFCQMLPILNAEILAAGNGMIFVSNNELSMAELLYDFDIHDYYFDLNKEFYDNKLMLMGFWMNSYLFDSVTGFRFDRLDFFFDSGTYEDYRKILSDYLKDDTLFEQAFNETQGGVETLLSVINGTTKQTKHLYNILNWFQKVEELDLDLDYESPLKYDTLILHIQRSGKFLGDESAVASMLEGVHKKKSGVSVAKVLELAEYIYVCCNHVEDNHKMLDAVYNLSSGANYEDAHYRAARAVYDLYGDNVALGLTERVGKEILKEMVKAPLKKFEIYELTAKTAGALWELVIPGNTGDVSVLTLHAGVAKEALMSASAGNLETERAVEDYRLSLLLMMIASKKCYEIMARTFEGYGENAADYRAKIEKLENMIMGLYLVADNVKFDTYANFYVFEEQNRTTLKEGGFFDAPEPVQPGEVFGPEEEAYLDFLAQNPVYHYYALLDINRDGCKELLAMEQMYEDSHDVDLYLYKDGQVILGFEDIWGYGGGLSYHPGNLWIESVTQNSGDSGVWFYYLDETLTVRETSFSESDYSGKWYNGSKVQTDDQLNAWYALQAKYDPAGSQEILFQPVPDQPAGEPEQPTEAPTEPIEEPEQPTEFPEEWLTGDPYFAILSMHPEYSHYALVDINRDGCPELLASRGGTPGSQVVDIWVDRGYGLEMMWAFIYVDYANMTYSPENRWLQNDIAGDKGFGIEFFYMEEDGYINWESIAHYEWCGALYNGDVPEDWADYEAYERLENAYDPENSEEIIFLPVP